MGSTGTFGEDVHFIGGKISQSATNRKATEGGLVKKNFLGLEITFLDVKCYFWMCSKFNPRDPMTLTNFTIQTEVVGSDKSVKEL